MFELKMSSDKLCSGDHKWKINSGNNAVCKPRQIQVSNLTRLLKVWVGVHARCWGEGEGEGSVKLSCYNTYISQTVKNSKFNCRKKTSTTLSKYITFFSCLQKLVCKVVDQSAEQVPLGIPVPNI